MEPFKNRMGMDLGGTGALESEREPFKNRMVMDLVALGVLEPELEPFKNRMVMDLGGTGGFWNRNRNLLRTGSEWI